jgi:hypothetical protein
MLLPMVRAHSLLLAAALAGACASELRDEPTTTDGPPATTTDPAHTTTDPTLEPADSSGEPVDPTPWLCPTEPAPDPWFVLGWDYVDGWIDLDPGGPFTITIGGQGAWMIPLGVRGEGFCVPADPYAYDLVPTLDASIDAQGRAEPIAAVLGFPVSFQPLYDDEGGPGTLGYTFIPMIIDDAIDPAELEGIPATIHAELRARDTPPLSFTLDGVLTVSD